MSLDWVLWRIYGLLLALLLWFALPAEAPARFLRM